MAAYSAVASLEQHLKQLIDSDQFPLLDQKSQLQTFHQTISSLQNSVEIIFPTPKNDRQTASILENQIRDAIYKAQDAVESFISAKSTSFSFPEIAQKIDPITAQAKELADSIRKERDSWLDGDIPPPPRSGIISRTFRIVGQEKDKQLLTNELINEEDKLQILPISGMAGIGKTTLARSIYEDITIKNSFAYRAWVTVSQDYHVGDILARLLNSMESRGQKAGERVYEGSDDQLKVHMHQSLYNNKYLVVIDDMWDQDTWDKVRNSLPDNKNGSRIILTTRILSVAKSVKSSNFCHEMQPLDEENSWILLCDKAFEGKPCPPHLEKIGREIAKNCDGLPLSLTVIGGLLSQGRQTEEYWQTIEEDTNAAAAKGEEAYLEILSLSYNHLPARLKGCFLYLGAFPEDSDIPLSKLSKLWVAEGFLVISSPQKRLEKVAEDHLLDLNQRNLITVRKISSDGRIKTCGLHDSLRDLAVQESGKEKFFHSVRRYANAQKLEEGAVTQRRVAVHKNILICLKDVYHTTKSISDARTLIYAGSHHHHPMPLFLTYDLLRVLDAYTVYFIRFPQELAQLIHLRYLSLTYNGKLGSSLSKLQNLQVLMVRRQPRIIFVGKSFLPDEFWNMQELRHLVMTETDLPKIPENQPLQFANLQSLTNINAASCTREVLKSMPNLKKLGMWVQRPGVVGLYLDELKQLEAFKFSVLNPSPSKQVEFEPDFFLPRTLRKLSLTGCGLPWEAMEVIAALPELEVLKLRELAFNGEEWELSYVFEKLKFLMIEYLNLKRWIADQSHFPGLEQLYMRHCYDLEEIPSDIGYIGHLEVIELVDCSPAAVESADEIKQEQETFDKKNFQNAENKSAIDGKCWLPSSIVTVILYASTLGINEFSLQEISKRLIPYKKFPKGELSKLGKLLKQHVSQPQAHEDQITQEIHQQLVQLKTVGEKYVQELYDSMPGEGEEEEEEEDDDSSRTVSGEDMVGLVYEFNKLKHGLRISWSKSTQVTALVGMAGIGKTALARKLFEDPKLAEHFQCRVWVTIGKERRFKEIPRRILAELNAYDGEEGDENTAQHLKEKLKGKRFLIVLDDVWDKYMMYHLHPSYKYKRNELKDALQDKINGSQVLFTSRLHQVDEYNVPHPSDVMKMRFLNIEESWDLLRINVFGEESYPFQLEKFGKKIAEKCDGLPLTIITVAKLLSENENSLEYWGEVAESVLKNHEVFMAAYDEILKVLLPSYKYIPKLLKMCFLYMGVFPRNFEISQSKLIDMWDADGFLDQETYKLLYPNASKCLEELVLNSLVMVNQKTMDDSGRLGAKQIKTCSLHSALWQISNKEGTNTKFSHVLSISNDAFGEGIEGQSRISFHNNVLFGIKEVYESVEENCASTAHSLLCYGPFHKYQVPVLDALTIRFYEFPMQVLELVQLRFLALTLNGELPSLISQLSNLQFLIVDQYLSIKSDEGLSHLPMEIWDMKELKQIQVMGSDLLDPCGSSSLEKLMSTLSNVSVHSCTEAVLKGIPNVKKLGIRIQLDEDDYYSHLSCFDHVSHLNNLRSLKCVVMNPEVVIPSLAPMSFFPLNLTKLSLSGMGYPWKEASKISSLPCLHVLKLRNYAFQGPEWEVEEEAFSLLTVLIIEDTDLEIWKIGRGSIDDLETLTVKHCYNLERIHGEFGGFLGGIVLVNCNPVGAEEMKKATQDWKVDVRTSWEDKKHKS